MPDEPIRELTPEEKRAIYDAMKQKFTADDLFGYIENKGPYVPFREVVEEIEEMVRQAEAQRPEAGSCPE